MDVEWAKMKRAKRSAASAYCLTFAAAVCLFQSGCAALSNPVADGIPVNRLRPELLAKSKEDLLDIPQHLLRRRPVGEYRIGPGDTLGIVLDGIIGRTDELLQVKQVTPTDPTPAIGYPMTVLEDGTLPLPQVPPLQVEGLTIPEIYQLIKKTYVDEKGILLNDQFVLILTLYKKRTTTVLVIRQDSSISSTVQNTGLFGSTTATTSSKRGNGAQILLPEGENDVLTALIQTGGLPGLDAMNEVVIQRNRQPVKRRPGQAKTETPAETFKDIVRIPLRLRAGEPLPFNEEDIILHDRDVVFIASRDSDYYYTGGLLLSGQFPVPRDYDLDVVQAIAQVHGPLINGAFFGNNIQGNVLQSGIGAPNPSRLTIIRRTADGGEVRIKVDLNKALRDKKERILIQPYDMLVLQQSPAEALFSYMTQQFRLTENISILKTPTVTTNLIGAQP
jgi:protein involved in polysaccharide export with SLBB domain